MAPASSLTALLNSPGASDGSTIIAGKTLPDISLGSLGSSFRSDDSDHPDAGAQRRGVARSPRLPTITSPDNSIAGPSERTPSPPNVPASALLSLSPPTTVRRSSSQSVLPNEPGSHAPRRNRILGRSTASSVSSASDSEGPLRARYGSEDEDEGVLSALSINVSPAKRHGTTSGKAYHAGPSKRSGRHSVAADVGSGPMTLREQEQASDNPVCTATSD